MGHQSRTQRCQWLTTKLYDKTWLGDMAALYLDTAATTGAGHLSSRHFCRHVLQAVRSCRFVLGQLGAMVYKLESERPQHAVCPRNARH